MLQHIRRSLARTPATTHFVYIIAFLLFVIYIMLSINFAQVESVRDILNFALGFGSLTLALVAIFQTTLSGAELNKLTSVASASAEASRTAAVESVSKINAEAARISEISISLSSEVETLRRQTENLQPSLSQILSTLGERFDEQNSILTRLSTNTDETKSSSTIFTKENSPPTDAQYTPDFVSENPNVDQNKKDTKMIWKPSDFDNRTTNGAFRALYAIALAWQEKKPIIPKQIHQSMTSSSYLSGCLAGLRAAGVIDTKKISGGKFYIESCNISNIDEIISIARDLMQENEEKPRFGSDLENQFLYKMKETQSYFLRETLEDT